MHSSADEIFTGLASPDDDDVYPALISIGKEELREFEGMVPQYLASANPRLRSASIRVLAFYWRLERYESVALSMALQDSAPEVRTVALMAWAAYYLGSGNRAVMNALGRILSNNTEDNDVRVQAYTSLLQVSGISPREWPQNALLAEDPKDIDWAYVDGLLRQVSKQGPEDLGFPGPEHQ